MITGRLGLLTVELASLAGSTWAAFEMQDGSLSGIVGFAVLITLAAKRWDQRVGPLDPSATGVAGVIHE